MRESKSRNGMKYRMGNGNNVVLNPSSKDIWLGKSYLMSTNNPVLYRFMQDSKNELKRSVPHRRGIAVGYQRVNLDSLKQDGSITEKERQVASRVLGNIRGLL